jgi:hypothetical protein
VQAIVDTCIIADRRQYLLQWRGSTEETWEDAANLNCPDPLAEFQAHNPAMDGLEKAIAWIVRVRRIENGIEYTIQRPDGTHTRLGSAETKHNYPMALINFFGQIDDSIALIKTKPWN